MKLKDKFSYCKICKNGKIDYEKGLLCDLTDEKPYFEETCEDFKINEENAERLADRDSDVKKIITAVYVDNSPKPKKKRGFFSFRK